MKKRICFVGFTDDKTEALKSLKQALSGISGAWDCAFFSNGAKALAAMTNTPFDAVVTHMHLEGTSGAELLQAVAKLHPKSLRFVIGEVADQELIINCIGATHQFIAKPCEPKTLISTIQRSLALDEWLSTDELRALVPRLGSLPSLPSTYFQVLKQVESSNATVQGVGEVISRDPAVTARILQMVNSASLALDQKVTDPVEAVSVLGMETVKSLVLCLQVFSQDDQARKAGLSFNELWQHSFAVASIAREIAVLQPGGSSIANSAFTAGLLHDIGRIVMASNLTDEYSKVVKSARENSTTLIQEEFEQFGVTHAQVGAYLLGLWGMPADIVEAAALHHTPSKATSREFSLLTSVHIANAFAHEKDGHTAPFEMPKLDLAYLNSLGLAEKTNGWRLGKEASKPAPAKPAPAKPQAPPQQATPPAIPLTLSKSVPVNTTPPPPPAPPALPVNPGPPPVRVVVTAHAAAKPSNRLVWAVVPAVILVLVIALFLWFKRSDSTVQARTADDKPVPARLSPEELKIKLDANSNKAAEMADMAKTNAAAMAEAAALEALDSVKVQGIFFRANNPSVIINGKTVSTGDKINGVLVLKIEPMSVTLSSGGHQKVVRVR